MNRALGAIAIGLGLGTTAVSQTVDQLLPEHTLFAVSVDDLAAYSKGMQEMPLAKLMHEEEMVAFLEQPKAAVRSAIQTLQDQLRSQEGFENFEVSLDSLMAGEYGRVFVAVTHFALPDPQSGVEFPDVGLVIGWEGRKGAPDWQALLKDAVARVAGSTGKEFGYQPVTRGGQTYEELVGGEDSRPPVLLGRAGDLQLLSLSHETMTGILARAQGGTSGSLAANTDYQAAQKVLAVNGSGAVRVYLAAESAIRVLAEAVKMGMQMDNQAEYIPLVDRLLEKSGLLALKAITVASESVGGVAHSRSFVRMVGERKGLLALAPGKPLAKDRLKLVPKAVGSFGISQFDFAGLYDFILEVVHEVDADAHAEVTESIAQMGAAIGGDAPIDVRKDILGNIGPEFMYVQPQSTSAMMPSFLFMAEVRDGDKVLSALKSIVDFASAQSGSAFSARTSDYKGTQILQIDLPSDVPIPLSPSIAVSNGQLLISLTVGDLKKQLRFTEKDTPNVTENEDFQRFFGKIPKEATLTALSYTDIKAAFESGYGQVVTMLPMVTMMAETELPVDLTLMPTSETVTKNLFGSLSYSLQTKDGEIQEGYSPIGGELMVGVVAALVGGGAAAAVLMPARIAASEPSSSAIPPPMPVEQGPEEVVVGDLRNLKAGVTIFKLQNGKVPTSLDQLLQPSADYPDGYLGSSELPVDPWGNQYLYKVEGSGYVLWSMGPNGVDNAGGEDDIAIRK